MGIQAPVRGFGRDTLPAKGFEFQTPRRIGTGTSVCSDH